MTDLVARTEAFLDGLIDEASTPAVEGQDPWLNRDKLALAQRITEFLAFLEKHGDGLPRKSGFSELKDALDGARNRSPRN